MRKCKSKIQLKKGYIHYYYEEDFVIAFGGNLKLKVFFTENPGKASKNLKAFTNGAQI